MKVRARAAATLGGAILAIALTAGPTIAAGGGSLDPAFGSGGVARVTSPVRGYTLADHLVVRVGPTGRIFLFEDMSAGDTSDSAFLRARTSSGGVLTAFHGGTIPYLSSSGDGAVSNLGLAPLADGGVVYSTMTGDLADPPLITTVLRAADGHAVASRTGVPGLGLSNEDAVRPFTRLPGGSLRFCGQTVTGVATQAVRVAGLTAGLTTDTRVGPGGFRDIALESCQGITSDAAGRIYAIGTTTPSGGHPVLTVEAMRSDGSVITTWGDGGLVAIAGADSALAGSCSPFPPGQFRTLADGTVVIPIETTGGSCATATDAVVWIKKNGHFIRTSAFDADRGRWRVFAMDVDAAGRAIVSLGLYPAGGSPKAYIGRLTNVGVFDPAFGVDGLVPVPRAPRSLDVDSASRIVGAYADGAVVVLTRRKG